MFLVKDYNRHMSYNMAVTCFRIAVVVFIIAGLVFAYRQLVYKPEPLTFDGEHTYTVTKLEDKSYRYRRRTYHHYYVTCTDENGESHHQTVTKAILYSLKEGESYKRTAFTKPNGTYYISWRGISSVKAAEKDYYELFPDSNMIYMKWGAIIAAGIGAFLVMAGLGELSREKKYYSETAIMRNGYQK
ncbi:MAG: hypothetical protein IJ561_06800 [Ruminococcus sp.]|nr:hypothetical protein [Ruminococcus sp.]